jgi:hypothetical protein
MHKQVGSSLAAGNSPIGIMATVNCIAKVAKFTQAP